MDSRDEQVLFEALFDIKSDVRRVLHLLGGGGDGEEEEDDA